tara:strand:- start:90 stop:305 length:216 start_codon:yes stop_codon:yes gene_type:complete
MEFSGIYVDNEFNLNFISHYSEIHGQIERAYKEQMLNQKQFRALQQEITETYYKDFFIQEIDCNTNLISIV